MRCHEEITVVHQGLDIAAFKFQSTHSILCNCNVLFYSIANDMQIECQRLQLSLSLSLHQYLKSSYHMISAYKFIFFMISADHIRSLLINTNISTEQYSESAHMLRHQLNILNTLSN